MFVAFLQGMVLNAGLIIAIGAQNAFVIAQGIRRRHLFVVALICSCCDALLIGGGLVLAGAADMIGGSVLTILTLAGVVFLLWLGWRAVRAAVSGETVSATDSATLSLRQTITVTLALSLLNPHAILDMTIIFGSAAAGLPINQRLPFVAGGVTLSFLWFFILAYGAAQLSPLLARPIAQRLLNGIVAVVMFIAAVLLSGRLVY